MKKVLIITSLFPNKYNEISGIFIKQQVDELANHYDVRVVATCFPYKLDFEEENESKYNVNYVFYPLYRKFYLSSVYFYKKHALPVIKKIIREWAPDLIHVHEYKHYPELFVLHKSLLEYKIPMYLTVHNIRTHPEMIESSYFKWIYKLTFGQSYKNWHYIFTVNNRLKEKLNEVADGTKITVIGNAIGPIPAIEKSILNDLRTKILPTGYNIIAVGNLVKEKGFDILIAAIGDLVQTKHKDIYLYIVGEGPERKLLQKLANDLGLSGRVFFLGCIANGIVRNMYSLFDVFVLPSYSETFGIVYIEAMYSGLPIIGIKGQGIDGIVQNGINGLLVNPKDQNDLTEKMEFLINHKDFAKEIAVRGQLLVINNYMQAHLIDKITKIYKSKS